VVDEERLPKKAKRAELVHAIRQTVTDEEIATAAKAMALWWIGNPTKRKTRRGVPRFVTGWIARQGAAGNGTDQSEPVLRRIYGRELSTMDRVWRDDVDGGIWAYVDFDDYLAKEGLKR
jgi:hypothetical protein